MYYTKWPHCSEHVKADRHYLCHTVSCNTICCHLIICQSLFSVSYRKMSCWPKADAEVYESIIIPWRYSTHNEVKSGIFDRFKWS